MSLLDHPASQHLPGVPKASGICLQAVRQVSSLASSPRRLVLKVNPARLFALPGSKADCRWVYFADCPGMASETMFYSEFAWAGYASCDESVSSSLGYWLSDPDSR